MKVNDKSNIEEIEVKVVDSLKKYEKTRFIFDATDGSISIASMKKLKMIFDNNRELAEIKLEETCIILTGEMKKKLVRFFINSVDKIRPVRIL